MPTFIQFPLLVALLLAAASAPGGELRVGRASVDITPDPGTPMLTPQRPPFEVKLAAAPHDPLHVKAIVLESGDQRAAIVSCDLTSIPLRMHQEARQIIGRSTKINPDNVMISATHCHTAPQIRAKFFGKADEAARAKGLKYIDALPGKIAEAVRLAEADSRPAKASAALGSEGSVSFNRRYFLRDGTVMTNPFKGEDEKLGQVVRPAGPIDPEIGLVAFKDETGKPLVVLINFAIHLDTMGGDQPSADFPFMIQQLVGAVHGPEALVYWASGASGNINHYDLTDPVHFRREKGLHESSRIGAILSADALRMYPLVAPVQSSPLRVARQLVRLDYHPEKCAELLAKMKDTSRYFDGEVDVINEGGQLKFDAEVQTIALGDELAWVGLPGEMFTEFGLALKKASPFRYTIVHSLANGAIGYVPNRRAYPEGSYEALATRCAPGSGERLVEAATDLLIQVKNTQRPSTVAHAR
jgi:hypothetical protein